MSSGARVFLQRSVKGYINISSTSVSELAVSARVPISLTPMITRGPAGTPGLDGGVTTVTAAEALGGFRAVTVEGLHCEGTDAIELAKYAGVTVTSGTLGSEVEIRKNGLITLTGETLTPNQPIFVGANGVLTQVLPMNPFRRIGWAVTTEIVNLDPFPSILGD